MKKYLIPQTTTRRRRRHSFCFDSSSRDDEDEDDDEDDDLFYDFGPGGALSSLAVAVDSTKRTEN